ncbi:MAG: DNA polymerase, partial [Bacteroidales bacterium]|nr:DNA polymerase [Bacteroidales bacterium]
FEEDDSPEELKSRERETAICLALAPKVLEELKGTGMADIYYKIEEPLIRVLGDMERTGVKVDVGELGRFADGLRLELSELEARIRETAGSPAFNPSSPKQVGTLIFEQLALDPRQKKSASGAYPTDEETLTALSDRHPVIGEILEYRAVKKLLGTYIEPFPGYIEKDGRIHTTFNQAMTSTGRLSSSKPNLQNIPIRTERGKEIRKAFVPETPGALIVSADYSQIELRIMAHLSGDTHLIEAFNEGQDVHKATAAKIFGKTVEEVSSDERRIAKTANFGIMYGISAFGLSQRLHNSRSEAKKIIEDYFASFPAISAFIEDTLSAAREKLYVETLFGRRRYIPDINARNANVRALAERNAVNAPIQGTSADIIKIAMARVAARLGEEGLRSRMILQIHDELLFEALPEELEALKEIITDEMEHVVGLSIPLTVECNEGENWLEAH